MRRCFGWQRDFTGKSLVLQAKVCVWVRRFCAQGTRVYVCVYVVLQLGIGRVCYSSVFVCSLIIFVCQFKWNYIKLVERERERAPKWNLEHKKKEKYCPILTLEVMNWRFGWILHIVKPQILR